MKTLIIVGGSKGIGKAIAQRLLPTHYIINISRTAPDYEHAHLTHHSCDILTDDLPQIESADGLVYCPGSINLKPISRLILNDFRADFEINVLVLSKAYRRT